MSDIPDGFELVNVPLSAVGFIAETARVKQFPDGREITFYTATPDQFVKAYADDGSFVWAPVAGFSTHKGVEVVIVDLANGAQIITDHDPRAVFGVVPGTTEPARFYPDDALARGVLVPCEVPDGVMTWGEEALQETYDSLWDAIDRKAELLATRKLGSRISWDNGWWLLSHDLLVADQEPPHASLGGVRWTAVVGVQYTGIKEDGYDLTVPNYETFMSSDGVILSNTMSVHLPSTPEAVKDVREKMMASKMLWSIKDRGKVLAAPKHEQILGLGMGYDSGGKKRKFATAEEAMKAIEDGQIDLNDDIEIS